MTDPDQIPIVDFDPNTYASLEHLVGPLTQDPFFLRSFQLFGKEFTSEDLLILHACPFVEETDIRRHIKRSNIKSTLLYLIKEIGPSSDEARLVYFLARTKATRESTVWWVRAKNVREMTRLLMGNFGVPIPGGTPFVTPPEYNRVKGDPGKALFGLSPVRALIREAFDRLEDVMAVSGRGLLSQEEGLKELADRAKELRRCAEKLEEMGNKRAG